MAEFRQTLNEYGVRLMVFRDRKRLENSDGAFNYIEFLRGFEIFQSLAQSTTQATFIFEDAAGISGIFTGSEIIKVQVSTPNIDREWTFRSFKIGARARTKEETDVFQIDAVSEEFIKNETVNIFGHSRVIFQGKIEAKDIVEQLIRDERFIGSKKNLYLEDTVNQHAFVMPNWRPLDVIYWMLQRTVRKSSQTGGFQNGFCFFENDMGYHMKSFDKLIEDIEEQSFGKETDFSTGKAQLYRYSYSEKNVDPQSDFLNITGFSFPKEKDSLEGLRHGCWSGYSVGFDPVSISSSKMGLSRDMSTDAIKYNMDEVWSKMAHLNGKKTVNPIEQMDSDYKQMLATPKRVRYSMLSNQVFDPKFVDNPQANYQEQAELQAYQWMRIETLKNIQMNVTIPGNLDLYVGSGIQIEIPTAYTTREGKRTDMKYSGRYMIKSITHSFTGNEFQTELSLCKDSILKDKSTPSAPPVTTVNS